MTTLEPFRILLVEDDSSIGQIIKIGMRDLGLPYHLDYAYSAEEALELWHNQAHDLVLTDYNLRGKNGLELIHLLKQENDIVPMVLFTAYDTPDLRRAAARAGVAGFVAKPFFFDQFFDMVRSLLPAKMSALGA